MADDAYYKQQFFAESREMLDSVSDALLRIEANPGDAEALHAIFRSIHTIKGSAGVFSLQEVSAFAHHVESVLNMACEGIIPVTSELVDLFFQGVDALNALLDDAQHGLPSMIDQELVARFQGVSTGKGGAKQEAKPAGNAVVPPAASAHTTHPLAKEEIPDGLRGLLRSKAAQGMAIFRIKLNFTSDMLENGYDPAVLLRNLKAMSKLWAAFTVEPKVRLANFQPLNLYLETTVYMATTATLEEIQDQAFEPELMDVLELAETASQDLDAELLRDFVEESASLIEQMETSALAYERSGAADSLSTLFRAVHTVKGDASYVGLKRLGTFAHELESLLDKLRNGKLAPSGSVVDDILARVDTLKKAILQVQNGETDPEIEQPQAAVKTPEIKQEPIPPEVSTVFLNQVAQHRHVLETLCGSTLPKSEESAYRVRRVCQGITSAARFVGLEELIEYAAALEKTMVEADAAGYAQTRIKLLAWLDDITGKPRKLGEILIESGHVTSADLQSVLSQQKPLGELLVEEGKLERGVLDIALKKQAIMRVAQQQQQQAAEPQQQPEQAQAGMEIRVMRVDEDKIDALSNLIGELVVAKNTYDYMLRQVFSAGHLPPEVSKSFKDNLYLFSRLTSGLQQSLLSVRMIPIRGVFQKYARVVRDIARKQQKIIDFITEGEDTEVDKKVADLLSEPLIHMVRNACDHGIETPEERRAAGKPEKGTVLLRAWQEGSRLYVQVRDDGKGINRQKVYEKALIRGFEFDSPDDEGLLNVIFESGFSTKDEVTDVSGRGVGMDAVRSSVESLGGTISLESTQGQGSTITLELPMTMGITVALVVRAKDKHYAIPLDSVVENIKILPSQVRMFYDRKGIAYRGQVLPIERLDTLLFTTERTGDPRDLFRESPFSTFALEREEEELSVVVLNTAHGKFGVVVDGVTRNVELAIRPVPDILRDINLLSGVSILGDGKILLVLNPDNLV